MKRLTPWPHTDSEISDGIKYLLQEKLDMQLGHRIREKAWIRVYRRLYVNPLRRMVIGYGYWLPEPMKRDWMWYLCWVTSMFCGAGIGLLLDGLRGVVVGTWVGGIIGHLVGRRK